MVNTGYTLNDVVDKQNNVSCCLCNDVNEELAISTSITNVNCDEVVHY